MVGYGSLNSFTLQMNGTMIVFLVFSLISCLREFKRNLYLLGHYAHKLLAEHHRRTSLLSSCVESSHLKTKDIIGVVSTTWHLPLGTRATAATAAHTGCVIHKRERLLSWS